VSGGEQLAGDGVTQGIVRIGDTVRRPLRPFSLTIQAYLAHLRDAGFTGAVWGGTPAIAIRVAARTDLVSHCDYYPGNVVFRGGLPVALIDFDMAHPTTRLYDITNALWYWAPLRDPRDRSPAFADADIPPRVAVFADAYGMTARHRAEFAPFAVDVARRYHEDSRASAELDPVYRKLWEDGAKVYLPRAEAWLQTAAPAITARLTQPWASSSTSTPRSADSGTRRSP
jgi:hypothetical protein